MISKFKGPVAVVIAGVWLSGCSSFLSVGESEFSCPYQGTNNAYKCMGVRELYKATDGDMKSFGKKIVTVDKKSATEKQEFVAEGESGYEPTPWVDKPLPIRSQAKVMRIWVAPWEDEVGDLNAPGMVYTEIEPRRWNVGDGLVKRPAKLSLVGVSNTAVDGLQSDVGSKPFGVTNASGQSIGNLRNVAPKDAKAQQPTAGK